MGEKIFAITIFCVLLGIIVLGMILKPKCPECKTGKLHQSDVHKPDRWGNGMNIYKCDNCGKEWC